MLQRIIPATGEPLPIVGLGTYRAFDVGASETQRRGPREVLGRLVASGGKLVDSSPMYGRAEGVVGDLQASLSLRPQLFLATKVWTSGREAGIRQMERSLALMRTAAIDLLQIHNLVDWRTHTATLKAWKEQGRVRYIGITHYHAGAHADLEKLLRTRDYDFLQVNYSIGERTAERRLLPLAQELGIAVIANRPFAQSALFARVRDLPVPEWATDWGCTSWARLFLHYVLSHSAVTCAIPATGEPAHMAENAQADRIAPPDEPTRQRMAAYFDRL